MIVYASMNLTIARLILLGDRNLSPAPNQRYVKLYTHNISACIHPVREDCFVLGYSVPDDEVQPIPQKDNEGCDQLVGYEGKLPANKIVSVDRFSLDKNGKYYSRNPILCVNTVNEIVDTKTKEKPFYDF